MTKLTATLIRARYRTSVGDSNAAGKVPLIIQGASGQTASLIEAYDSSKNFLWGIDANGQKIDNGGATTTNTTTVSITSANITDTAAGHLGHANGVILVADPAAGLQIELVSVVMSFTFGVAQYTAGGNVTVNISGGGAALTGLVSAANSIGNAASKVVQFVPLSTVGNALTSAKGFNLVAASAFTQPGTATGTVKCFVTYRTHTL
jgi:hypothetical protein